MSEKRFELTKINPTVNLLDTVYFIIDYENPNKEIRTLKDCVGLLNEQQSTICKLQDLCGESDYENAKLRIENKKLKDDLHNCRLNKNIISEKLKMWQDVHKKYNIYNIKDFEELMKNDK